MAELLSIVIATYNRRPLLEATLAAIGRQTLPRDRYEVIVADNGSTDGTADALRAIAARTDGPRITMLHVPTPGKSSAVNAALERAGGSLVAFTDDDVRPEPRWIETLARAASETDADFIVGRILPDWECTPPAWLSPALFGILAVPDNGSERLAIRPGLNDHVMSIGANMAVRRAVLDDLGGWRSDLGKMRGTLRSGEDHEFWLRLLSAGCRGVYEPAARVRHLVPASRLSREYFRRWAFENGQMVATLEQIYPSTSRYLLRVPRYLWRDAARNAGQLVAGAARGPADRFTAVVRLAWFMGYLRQSWSGATVRGERPSGAVAST